METERKLLLSEIISERCLPVVVITFASTIGFLFTADTLRAEKEKENMRKIC